jgi:hypothetical protein
MILDFWLAAMKKNKIKNKDEYGCGQLPHLLFQQ